MSAAKTPVHAVPTNIITGFLGAGKTTAILHLLKDKPEQERWAVLVNEFGEIGVDGSMVQGQSSEESGVYVREVPGGCMCCASGLPMQIALTQLLSRVRPHRLLIEPTGLGHPLEVLQTLSDCYRDVLSIQKTLTLVDARNLSDERYTTHDIFRQQLSVADVVVGNKDDLYSSEDRRKLQTFVKGVCRPETPVMRTQNGRISLDMLAGVTQVLVEPGNEQKTNSQGLLAGDLSFPDCGYVTAINGGEGFESIGWRFSPDKIFDRTQLVDFLRRLDVERMKGVFITPDGVFAYNLTRDAMTEAELDDCSESRVEIIADRIDSRWVNDLTNCLQSER